MNPIAWPVAQRICDIPEVREALDKFAEDAQEENMLAMVSAIMGHAVTQGRAAGLEEERADLIAIGCNLLTQDNRCTDQPLFIVEQKRLIVGIDPEYANKIGWFDSDGMATPEEHEFLEKQYKKSRREPDGWTRTGYSEEWQFVTACFTEQGCKDYIRIDGHNLKDPRIYADGSYRNNEYRTVRNFLMKLAAIAAQGEGNHE
jgi:hypothetical protein